jgi:hypothetical protein
MMRITENSVARSNCCIATCLSHLSEVFNLKEEYTLSRQRHWSSLLEPHELKLIVSFMDLDEMANLSIHEHTIK